MKLLSITVPCFNSEQYMKKCIDSLLLGGDEVEIIIVNDGSTDQTGAIADAYALQYPDIVRVVHQENGGHGAAVNAGICCAQGLYFKVVDSDDWVDQASYMTILESLERLTREGSVIDLFLSNFVYEKQGSRKKKVMRYSNFLPEEQIFGWNDIGHVRIGTYFLMHSMIYRTQLLRSCGMKLPEHTFYVDNIFAFWPLAFVQTMYYQNVNFYRYFIGREDQSVNEKVMISRIDQQIKVNKIMVDAMVLQKPTNKKLRKYMLSYLDIITTVTSILLVRSKDDDEKQTRMELLNYIRQKDPRIYYRLKRGATWVANMPGKSGRTIAVTVYKIYQKLYGFN